MPFKKGQPKFSGRKAGTPNKITRDVAALLDSLNCNPLEGLAKIAADTTAELAIRARCYAELAKYVHPQLKSVEHIGSIRHEHELAPGAIFERVRAELDEKDTPRGTGANVIEAQPSGTGSADNGLAPLVGQAEPDTTRNGTSGGTTH